MRVCFPITGQIAPKRKAKQMTTPIVTTATIKELETFYNYKCTCHQCTKADA